MLPQNPRGTSAGNDNSAHVVFAIFAHDVRTNDAGNLRNVQEANGEDQRRQVVAENDDERSGQSDTWERHDDVEDTHDDFRDPLARNSGKRADDRTAHKRKRGSTKTDGQRVTRAIHHARKNVAALVVGTEEEFPIGSLTGGVNRQRIMRRNEVREASDEHDSDEHDKRNARADGHCLPATEVHLAGAVFHFLSKVSSKLSCHATPS